MTYGSSSVWRLFQYRKLSVYPVILKHSTCVDSSHQYLSMLTFSELHLTPLPSPRQPTDICDGRRSVTFRAVGWKGVWLTYVVTQPWTSQSVLTPSNIRG